MNIPEIGVMSRMPEDFNWFTVLGELEAGSKILPDEYDTLKYMAGNWPTCACGQLCQRLERDELGKPVDKDLSNLGVEFSDLINCRRWACAIATMNAIEERTTHLLELQCEANTGVACVE